MIITGLKFLNFASFEGVAKVNIYKAYCDYRGGRKNAFDGIVTENIHTGKNYSSRLEVNDPYLENLIGVFYEKYHGLVIGDMEDMKQDILLILYDIFRADTVIDSEKSLYDILTKRAAELYEDRR